MTTSSSPTTGTLTVGPIVGRSWTTIGEPGPENAYFKGKLIYSIGQGSEENMNENGLWVVYIVNTIDGMIVEKKVVAAGEKNAIAAAVADAINGQELPGFIKDCHIIAEHIGRVPMKDED